MAASVTLPYGRIIFEKGISLIDKITGKDFYLVKKGQDIRYSADWPDKAAKILSDLNLNTSVNTWSAISSVLTLMKELPTGRTFVSVRKGPSFFVEMSTQTINATKGNFKMILDDLIEQRKRFEKAGKGKMYSQIVDLIITLSNYLE